MLTLERGQPFLFDSDFFLTRFEMEGCSTTDFESRSSSSQGAGEWKRILGPQMLIRGSSSGSWGESSGSWPSRMLLSSEEDRGSSSSRSRLEAVGMFRRSLSEIGERGSEREGV